MVFPDLYSASCDLDKRYMNNKNAVDYVDKKLRIEIGEKITLLYDLKNISLRETELRTLYKLKSA